MKTYKVVGIGNAVVDVITHADDGFLADMEIDKGIMQLVDQDRSDALSAKMTNATTTPGGSVANTISGIGSLGLSTAYIGRVSDDALGLDYAKTMADEGTYFANPPVAGGELPTSRSMIFVSPDGERSMNTYLGISAELGPEDVSEDVAVQAEIVFLEGYLFDKDKGKNALIKLARACRAAGGKAGISISDPFCVERHRDDFLALIENELDFVIGNEDEVKSLFQTNDLDEGMQKLASIIPLAVCTRSSDGVSVLEGATRIDIPVTPVTPVDATGAGDQFAAGFIYGLATGRDLQTCGKMGCIAAGEVIAHIGPRPEADIAALFAKAGLTN